MSGGLGSGLPFGVGGERHMLRQPSTPNPTVDMSTATPAAGDNGGAKFDPNATPDGKPIDQMPTINNPNSTGTRLPNNANQSTVPNAQFGTITNRRCAHGQTIIQARQAG